MSVGKLLMTRNLLINKALSEIDSSHRTKLNRVQQKLNNIILKHEEKHATAILEILQWLNEENENTQNI